MFIIVYYLFFYFSDSKSLKRHHPEAIAESSSSKGGHLEEIEIEAIPSSSDEPNSDEIIVGLGHNSLKTIIDHITNQVISNLTSKPDPSETNKDSGFVSSLDLQPELVQPEINLSKNLANDQFDDEILLKNIPKHSKKNAKKLLDKINQNAQHITFNSSGILFIDGISIPDSNFFVLFPFLFRKHLKSTEINAPGLIDLFKKLTDLHLNGLINLSLIIKNTESSLEKEFNPSEMIETKKHKWWYIGP